MPLILSRADSQMAAASAPHRGRAAHTASFLKLYSNRFCSGARACAIVAFMRYICTCCPLLFEAGPSDYAGCKRLCRFSALALLWGLAAVAYAPCGRLENS